MKFATLGYIRQNGKTLMLHRIKKANDMHQGKWNGLGGKLEDGETPEECIIREIKEESGLEILEPQLKGLLTIPAFDNLESWSIFVFLITKFEGQMIDSSEGELAWIETDKLWELNLWDGDKIFLKWLDQPGFFSGKFIYKDGRLIEHQVVTYK